jgi:4-amino-4-deoxy-L-arabinose transferase-like glycosyltransferase
MALARFIRNIKYDIRNIHIFLACWIFAVFCIFQPAHSKLSSYILPLFPALGIITGDCVSDLLLLKSRNWRRFFIPLAVFSCILLILAGLIVLLNNPKYAQYKTPVSILIAIYASLTLLSLIFIIKRSLLKNVYLLVISIFILLWSVLIMHSYAEPYVSSKISCDYLLKNYNVKGYILCSKPFVRGVRYYTDKPVAVVNIHSSENNFFSPHPIPYLHSGEELKEFLKKQPITYCILKKSSVDEVKSLAGKEFNFTLLKAIENQHIFVVSFIGKL